MAAGNLRGMVRHPGGLHHGFGNMSVDLYAHRRLFFGGPQFREGFRRIPDQSVRRYEFGIYHVRSLLAAEQPE